MSGNGALPQKHRKNKGNLVMLVFKKRMFDLHSIFDVSYRKYKANNLY